MNPKEEQWAFAINYTASWCGPCGNWGVPLIHDMYDEGKTVAICAHANNDPMNNDLASSFKKDRPTGGGIPAFWVGDTKSGSSSGINDIQNLKSQAPTAGIDLDYELSGGKATVDVKVKFFDGGSGDYYLSTFVLESGIDGSSSAGQYNQKENSDPDFTHDFVLRASSVEK